MKIIIKREGMFAPAEVVEVEKLDLPTMQDYVGGYVECPHIPDLAEHGVDIWVNEEGKFTCKPNFLLPWGDTVHGVAVFAGHTRNGDTKSLTKKQIEFTLKWISERPGAILT